MKQKAAKNQVSKLKRLFKKVDQSNRANISPVFRQIQRTRKCSAKKLGALDTDVRRIENLAYQVHATFNNLLAAQIILIKEWIPIKVKISWNDILQT